MEITSKHERVIAFDVETPNSRNDRMSSIGIAVIENGTIVDTYSSLINPETYFNRFNINLTGITPEMAKNAPPFPDVWNKYGELFQSGLLIAHNATFDMRVLSSCICHYRLETPQMLRYACTVQMGRRLYPSLPNHKLDTMCRHCSIELDHHKAESDSLACAKLYLDYLAHGMQPKQFIRTYDVKAMRTLR